MVSVSPSTAAALPPLPLRPPLRAPLLLACGEHKRTDRYRDRIGGHMSDTLEIAIRITSVQYRSITQQQGWRFCTRKSAPPTASFSVG